MDEPQWLIQRWIGYEQDLQRLVDIIKVNPDWHNSIEYKVLLKVFGPFPNNVTVVDRDLRGSALSELSLERANLAGAHLEFAHLERTDLKEARLEVSYLSGAHLEGALLSGAHLEGTSAEGVNFSGANLTEANISNTHLYGANFARCILYKSRLLNADLREANLSDTKLMEADLSRANLTRASISGAFLWNANLYQTSLYQANLSGTKLFGANLEGSDLSDVVYTTDEICNRIRNWWVPKILRRILKNHLNCVRKLVPAEVTDFGGIDTSKINGSTNPVLKRHMEDYQFIQGFMNKGWLHKKLFYRIWKYTSDCGRSLLLWLLWSILFVALFTGLYSLNIQAWFRPIGLDWFNALYFSIVTFTTLGFGDVTPSLASRAAQSLVMAQVIVGYIMLGGLISILANKLARRA